MTQYIIKSTDFTNSVTIEPGNTDGALSGSDNNSTDLLLYGRGAFEWGQGIEQNLLRLTENWASDAEDDSVPDADQVPKVYGEPNKGIHKPIAGQNWWNKSNKRQYTYDDTNWVIDGEGRYVPIIGDTNIDGRLSIVRPAGVSAALRVISEGSNTNVTVDLLNSSDTSARIKLSPGSNSFRLERLVDVNSVLEVENYIELRNDYIQTHFDTNDASEGAGKIRTPFTKTDDHPGTLTSKNYVDSQIVQNLFAGGEIPNDISLKKNSGDATIRITANNQTDSAKLILADSSGDKFDISMVQIPGTEVIQLVKYTSTGNQGLSFYDDYIETNATNGKIRTPSTLDSDNGQTLTTRDYIEGNFLRLTGGTMSGNIAMEKLNPRVVLDGQNPILEFRNATSSSNSSIDFYTAGGKRGTIVMAENFPVSPSDTLVFRKVIGSQIKNEIRMRDESTEFTRAIVAKSDVASDSYGWNNPTAPRIQFKKFDGETVIGTIAADNDDALYLASGDNNSNTSFLRINDGLVTVKNKAFDVLPDSDPNKFFNVNGSAMSVSGIPIVLTDSYRAANSTDTTIESIPDNVVVDKKVVHEQANRYFRYASQPRQEMRRLVAGTNDDFNWYNAGGTSTIVAEEAEYTIPREIAFTENFQDINNPNPKVRRILVKIIFPYVLRKATGRTPVNSGFREGPVKINYRQDIDDTTSESGQTIPIGTMIVPLDDGTNEYVSGYFIGQVLIPVASSKEDSDVVGPAKLFVSLSNSLGVLQQGEGDDGVNGNDQFEGFIIPETQISFEVM